MSEEAFEKLREEMLREAERVFSDIEYPGDDRLVNNIEYPDSQEIAEDFKGKHWSEISQKLVYKYWFNFPRFTPKAFCFYFPAFLKAALDDPIDANFYAAVDEQLFFHLVPPEEGQGQMENFLTTTRGFSPDQEAVVRTFMKLFMERNPYHAKMYGNRAKDFWKIGQ